MARPKRSIRLAVSVLSWAAILASAYYIGRLLLGLWGEADVRLDASLAAPLLLGSVAYALLHAPLGAAWGLLLSAAVHGPVRARGVAVVYGRSQIAKYLPSNVLHFAGRQLLGAQRGWPPRPRSWRWRR